MKLDNVLTVSCLIFSSSEVPWIVSNVENSECSPESSNAVKVCISFFKSCIFILVIQAFRCFAIWNMCLIGLYVFRDIILQCLDDKDEFIRRRALDLIVGMVSVYNMHYYHARLMQF